MNNVLQTNLFSTPHNVYLQEQMLLSTAHNEQGALI